MRWLLQEDADFFTSVEGLAQTIGHILEHPEEATEKASRGQERVRKSLTLEHACGRLEPHIHGAIKEHLAMRIRQRPQDAATIYDAEHRRNAMGPIQQFSPEWSRHWRAQEFIRILKEHGAQRIGDAGCGPIYPIIFAREGFEVVAFDISEECVDQVKELATKWGVADRVEAIRGEAENMQFTGETFDAVVHGELWEHVPDPRKVIEEGLRVLKPGGILVASAPVGEHHFDPLHLRLFDDASLAELLTPWKDQVRRLEKIAEEGTEPSCYLVVIGKP